MAQRLRNGVVFLQGHDGEFTFLVKNGLLMETHILSWSFEKTFKRSKLTHQTSPTITLSAPFAEMDGTKLGGSSSGFAGDQCIKDVLPDNTAECHFEQRSITRHHAGRGSVQAKPP